MRDFVFDTRLPRTVFGAGSLRHLGREMELLGLSHALVLTTPGQRAMGERVAAMLGARSAGIFAEAAMHVPVETARAASAAARMLCADCAIAVGGGSTTGLGKAIALNLG